MSSSDILWTISIIVVCITIIICSFIRHRWPTQYVASLPPPDAEAAPGVWEEYYRAVVSVTNGKEAPRSREM